MFLFRNNMAIGAIFALIISALKLAVDVIYKVLKALKLQFLALVLFVGFILYATNIIFNDNDKTITYVWIGFLAVAFFYTIIANTKRIKKFFSRFSKKDSKQYSQDLESKEVKEIETPKIEQVEREVDNFNEDRAKNLEKSQKYPKYYRVSQNSNFIMAEYKDRYELFLKKDGKTFKVRTDKKGDCL